MKPFEPAKGPCCSKCATGDYRWGRCWCQCHQGKP